MKLSVFKNHKKMGWNDKMYGLKPHHFWFAKHKIDGLRPMKLMGWNHKKKYQRESVTYVSFNCSFQGSQNPQGSYNSAMIETTILRVRVTLFSSRPASANVTTGKKH